MDRYQSYALALISCLLLSEILIPCHAIRPIGSTHTVSSSSRDRPDQQQQQRSLLQFGGNVAGKIVEAAPQGVDIDQQQQQQRSLLQFGGNIGPIIGAVAQGVDVGIDLAAPIVNAVASNVPIIVPSFNGLCMNGEPIAPFKQRPDVIMCLVGNGAQVTNYLFNAVSRLGDAAGGFFG